MINIDTLPSWLALIIAGLPILLGGVGIAYSLYLSRCHLDAIKEALKDSRYMYLWGPSLGKRGLIWSLLEIAKIAGMVVWPNANIRMGHVTATDLEQLPLHLKRHLIVNATIMFTAIAWMIVTAILFEFR